MSRVSLLGALLGVASVLPVWSAGGHVNGDWLTSAAEFCCRRTIRADGGAKKGAKKGTGYIYAPMARKCTLSSFFA